MMWRRLCIANICVHLDPPEIDNFLSACKKFKPLSNNYLWGTYFKAKFDPSAKYEVLPSAYNQVLFKPFRPKFDPFGFAWLRGIPDNYWKVVCREEFTAIALVWNRIFPQLVDTPLAPQFPTRSDIPNWIRMQLEKQQKGGSVPILPFKVTLDIRDQNIIWLPPYLCRLATHFHLKGNHVSCIEDAFQGQKVGTFWLDANQMRDLLIWFKEQPGDEDFSLERVVHQNVVLLEALKQYSGAEEIEAVSLDL